MHLCCHVPLACCAPNPEVLKLASWAWQAGQRHMLTSRTDGDADITWIRCLDLDS